MANAIYPKYKEAALGGGPDLAASDVKVALIDTALYTYSATHEFLSDVPAGSRVAASPNLTSKTLTDGYFDAANITWTSVTGADVEALIVYVDSGVEGTSRLVAYLDTNQGLPMTPNGGDLTYSVGTNGIFRL